MTVKGKDFFKQQQPLDLPPPPPKIPPCFGCFEEANPAWGDGKRVFCSRCAPPELKQPGSYNRTEDTCSRNT